MTARKFDVELFKRALIAGATGNGVKLNAAKLQREVERIAEMDARQQRELLEKKYLRDPHFRKVWVEGGGSPRGRKPKEKPWPA
jgi:hypothetical protein